MGLFGSLLSRVFKPPVAQMAPPPTARFDTRNVDIRQPIDIQRQAKGEQAQRETRQSLDAKLMPVVSSWVKGIRWYPQPSFGEGMGTLIVQFRNGAMVQYDRIPESMYDEFFAAGSKGRFVHAYLYRRPYRLLQAGRTAGRR